MIIIFFLFVTIWFHSIQVLSFQSIFRSSGRTNNQKLLVKSEHLLISHQTERLVTVLKKVYSVSNTSGLDTQTEEKPICFAVEIEYCLGCNWMLRSTWYAQELLSTFQNIIQSVTLIPNRDRSGVFLVRLNGQVVWDRKQPDTRGFPEVKMLKQRIRDVVTPDMPLGHSDKQQDILSF